MLRLSAAAIRRVDPGAVVISGGLSPVADANDPARIPPLLFLQALYAGGAMSQVDGVGVHPYTFPARPSTPGSAFARLPALHALITQSGGSARTVWVTEFGAPTGTGAGSVSEQEQSQIVGEACRQARTWKWLGPVFLYQLRDAGGDPNDLEQNFGLLRHDYSPKPAWQTWRDCSR